MSPLRTVGGTIISNYYGSPTMRALMDSGATHSVVPPHYPMITSRPSHGTIRGISGNLPIVGYGNARGIGPAFIAKDAPPLLSIPEEAERGLFTVFGPEGAVTADKAPIIRGTVLRTGTLRQRRYLLDYNLEYPSWMRRTRATGTRPVCNLVHHGASSPCRRPSTSEEFDLHDEATASFRRPQPSGEFDLLPCRRPSTLEEFGSSDRLTPEVSDEVVSRPPHALQQPLCCQCTRSVRASAAHLSEETFHFFHQVLGHLGRFLMNAMSRHRAIAGLPQSQFGKPQYCCVGCMLGNLRLRAVAQKEANRPLPPSIPRRFYRPLELISFDIIECTRYLLSLQGNRWEVVFHDHGSGMTWSYFFRGKTGLERKAFPAFFEQITSDGVGLVQALKGDSEHVNWSDRIKAIARSHNPQLKFVPTPPGFPAYNGAIESVIGVKTGRTRARIAGAPHAPRFLWQSASQDTTDILNICVTHQVQDTIPLRRYLPGPIIDISLLRPWGTMCWFNVSKEDIAHSAMPRFSNRGHLGIIVGSCDYGRAGHQVYDPYRKKIYLNAIVRLDAAAPWRKPTPIQLIRALGSFVTV